MNCEILSADLAACEHLSDRHPIARKQHKCRECQCVIEPGKKYRRQVSVCDGKLLDIKTCEICSELRSHFSDGSYYYGELWSTLRYAFFPNMVAGGPCIEGLSVAAKERLFEQWREWKGVGRCQS
jgi:hypothetical protein